ncbi:MAG TPA: response regulator [Stellaceae bacterium]|nr:response regulator [Stellaceae bacterium]
MLGAEPSRTARKRILVVEDNELNMKLLNDVLEAHGYEVMSTGRGMVAVEWAREYHPDLILMDLQLPDLSGLDATRQLKADPGTRAIPVIAVTAFAMAGDEKRALDHGCDAYVAKPIVLRDFLNLIVGLIGPGEIGPAEGPPPA